MKTLKIMTIAALSCFVIGAKAQSNTTAQQRTNYIKQHVTGITSDQESRILTIEQSCSNAMRVGASTHVKDSIHKSSDSRMKQVLSSDQYSQYKKIKKDLPKE